MLALSSVTALAQLGGTSSETCGTVVTLASHGGTMTRYALHVPASAPPGPERVALVLFVGGAGHLDLNERGCPRMLRGNSLVRSLPHFHAAGLATALVDAPSDHRGEDGLAGFRITAEHAADIGAILADLRARGLARLWLVGTSRGAISAANGAARLRDATAPDGLVLTSPVMAGNPMARRSFVAQSVFDLTLDAIRVPALVIGHAADSCARSPPALIDRVVTRLGSARAQAVLVTGGPSAPAATSVEACEGRSPHGFLDQEQEVAAGIARFVRGGRY
jgi:pimeloyl-ACP methyl ester carboxylesterase